MPPLVLALILVVVWTYLVATTVAAFRFARRPIERPAGHAPVSVLTPLQGAEPGPYENLCSFPDQDYRELQLVLGVRDRL